MTDIPSPPRKPHAAPPKEQADFVGFLLVAIVMVLVLVLSVVMVMATGEEMGCYQVYPNQEVVGFNPDDDSELWCLDENGLVYPCEVVPCQP